jgi:hypothetical protein
VAAVAKKRQEGGQLRLALTLLGRGTEKHEPISREQGWQAVGGRRQGRFIRISGSGRPAELAG